MREVERAKILAILKENSDIIKADGEEFFKNLSEDEKFRYLVSDMLKGKAIITEDDDGGVKIDLPMEQNQDIKIEKAAGEELEALAAKKANKNTNANLSGEATDVGEMGAFGASPALEESQTMVEETIAEPMAEAQSQTYEAPTYAEPAMQEATQATQVADVGGVDADIEAEMAKMKQEGLIQDNSQIVVENYAEDEDYAPSYEAETSPEPDQTQPEEQYSSPEPAQAETVEVVQEQPAAEPENESDLDRQIREEMEKMKNEGLVQDNSKIVIEKIDDENSMNY